MSQKDLFDNDSDNDERIRRLAARRKQKEGDPDPAKGVGPGPTGEELRDAALESTLKKAGEEWQSAARQVLLGLRGRTVTAEDIRVHCQGAGAVPHSPKAWGGLVGGWVKMGWLVATGEYARMKDPKSHGRETKVYLVK